MGHGKGRLPKNYDNKGGAILVVFRLLGRKGFAEKKMNSKQS